MNRIPALLFPMLSSCIPSHTWGGGPVTSDTLIIWRTTATEKAQGATLGFYTWDERLEPLWSNSAYYADLFRVVGIGALIEADFSLWINAPEEEQRYNVYRMRTLAKQWQMAGLQI